MNRIASRSDKRPASGLSKRCGWFRQARMLVATIALAIIALQARAGELAVQSLTSVGMTVTDVDRSVAFYHDVLGFEKVSEQEVAGDDFEKLTGVFGSRARIVQMRLGDETIELTQFLAPRGRPLPHGSRSNDLWFQHVAIIVRDMDEAYQRELRNRTGTSQ